VTWGTSPEDVVPITGVVPTSTGDEQRRATMDKALQYMGLADKIGEPINSLVIDKVGQHLLSAVCER
jgi:hypothetical protein